MVRSRIAAARAAGTLTADTDPVGFAKSVLAAGSRSLLHVTQALPVYGEDPQVISVWETLEIAYDGSGADARTALTRLQGLLTSLTAADADIAGDAQIQIFRQELHRLLDHGGFDSRQNSRNAVVGSARGYRLP
jgi:hypothetical protein